MLRTLVLFSSTFIMGSMIYGMETSDKNPNPEEQSMNKVLKEDKLLNIAINNLPLATLEAAFEGNRDKDLWLYTSITVTLYRMCSGMWPEFADKNDSAKKQKFMNAVITLRSYVSDLAKTSKQSNVRNYRYENFFNNNIDEIFAKILEHWKDPKKLEATNEQ